MNTIKSPAPDTAIELPWYKQFWPWFLIALPGSVVIAGISTAIIAFSGADALVHDNYYKKGLAINQSHQQVAEARILGITLGIKIAKDHTKDDSLLMTLKLSGDYVGNDLKGHSEDSLKSSMNDAIKLRFSHPTLKSRDFVIELAKQRTQLITLPSKVTGKWHLTLSNDTQTWLLRQSVILSPDTNIVIN
jgi:uncharacterized protein